MEELAGGAKYNGRVNFLMINCRGLDDAKSYAHANGLSECPHGTGPVPASYGVRYIPHKTLIGKDGKVIKNYESFSWSDIDEALAASGGYAASADHGGDRMAKNIAEAFAKFDANGDGLIDRRELKVLLDKIGLGMSVDEVINKADSDGNGRLDYAEFSAWICSADSGRLRRALGLASTGPDGGLAQCANLCGRAPFRHYKTCCTRCKGPDGPHAHSCDQAAGEAEVAAGPKCRNGCGRDPFGDYPTCCTHCTGADGPHSRSCNAAASRRSGCGGRPADSPRASSRDIALSKILGEELIRGDGEKVRTGVALSRCKVVGILFTAMW